MTYAASRKQILLTLHSKITQIKGGYASHGSETYWANYWPVVLNALRIALIYYKAEVVRCKHETLSYMKGLDAEDGYGDHAEINALLGGIRELSSMVSRSRQLEKNYFDYRNNPLEAPWREQAWDDVEKLVQSKLEMIEQLTKDVEGITYVGY